MNEIHIVPTIFTNARTGMKTYGVIVYDEMDQFYDNCWNHINDDDAAILQSVIDECTDERWESLKEYILDEQQGVYVGETYFIHEEVKRRIEGGPAR